MAGPAKGFGLYRPDVPPDTGPHFDVYQNVLQMAAMGADTIKLPMSWSGRQQFAFPEEFNGQQGYCFNGLPPLQGPNPPNHLLCPNNYASVNGPWSFDQPNHNEAWTLDQVGFVQIVFNIAKAANPNFKGIIISFGGLPDDIDGGNIGNKHPGTMVGCSQFGNAAARIVYKLGDICTGIEFGNEPNMKVSIPGGTEVTPDWYAFMAAYIIYWIYQCGGGFDSNSPNELKKRVLLGAVALTTSNSNNWTSGLSPQTWISQMSTYVEYALNSILPSDPTLSTKLHNAWRLSIHPYPYLGERDSFGRDPTDPDNVLGDRDAGQAFSTVWSLYDATQSLYPNRKIWITETGVSSRKLHENGQRDFFNAIGLAVKSRYDNGDRRLEGVINWGFNDCDPALHDSTSPYFQFGVISKSNGSSGKLAAAGLQGIYNGAWA